MTCVQVTKTSHEQGCFSDLHKGPLTVTTLGVLLVAIAQHVVTLRGRLHKSMGWLRLVGSLKL